ncbi:hypothetical protein O1504_19575, partial [Bacteroides fragilis]|uniref:hypothetical protein n=1 Tax=Bacteroides fragilis TaxID=817 RepID=UPI0022AB060A
RGGYLRILWGHGALQKRRFKRMNGFYIGSFTALNNLFYRRRSQKNLFQYTFFSIIRMMNSEYWLALLQKIHFDLPSSTRIFHPLIWEYINS